MQDEQRTERQQDETDLGSDASPADETAAAADRPAVPARAIGIDLGTTNSVVACVDQGKIRTLRIRNRDIIPSAIFFEAPEVTEFGHIARLKGIEAPWASALLFKRRLGDRQDVYRLRYHRSPAPARPAAAAGRTYVIDTNVFIDAPDILERFDPADTLIVSAKVVDELGYRKTQLETEWAASIALHHIEAHRERLQWAGASPARLPEDLDPRCNDNLILSIALERADASPVVLTSDRAFQLKCRQLGVAFVSLADFNQRPEGPAATDPQTFTLSGEEASALFLRYLRDEAAKQIGPVAYAAITVPANFNPVEIEATKNAALAAGFEDVQILKEPTAAAIAYGLESDERRKILVYDFGGGTFDVSIIEASGQGDFQVLHTGGDSRLGGEELTQDLIAHIHDDIEGRMDLSLHTEDESGLDAETYLKNRMALYREADHAKEQLSEFREVDIALMLMLGAQGHKSYSRPLRRDEFEDLVRPRIARTFEALGETIDAAGLKVDDIDVVILAGGSSLIPMIRERVQKYFGRAPSSEKNAATVIALGAAIVAAGRWHTDEDGIQTKVSYHERTVADFGVAVQGYEFDCLIARATDLPVRVTRDYSPVVDYQERLRIGVFRRDGRHPDARRTFDDGIDYVDRIEIANLPPMRVHEAVVKVTFELTKEDILQVDVAVCHPDEGLVESAALQVRKASRA